MRDKSGDYQPFKVYTPKPKLKPAQPRWIMPIAVVLVMVVLYIILK